ncbi:HalOD1 output domain-containing protein [Natrinema sp. DC36]|uniref:HalOD1 output domain-containing protein n=1 Tax=Natrinema sp. DC36 TaxID=2878680 RepID=UPI001CF06156|nr:HalOD1 output domain-containing protein [Natrinema sp. DC36]
MTELTGATADGGAIRRQLDTDQEDPAARLVEVIADIDDVEPMELAPIYYRIDGLITGLFSSPSPLEANAHVTFSYEGYRIRVHQDGTTTVRELSA